MWLVERYRESASWRQLSMETRKQREGDIPQGHREVGESTVHRNNQNQHTDRYGQIF